MDKIFFDSDEEFAAFIPGEMVVSVKSIQPRINDVTSKYIKPLVGEDLIEEVIDAYAEEAAMSEEMTELYNHMCKAVAHLSMALSTPDLNVRAAVGGFGVSTGQDIAIASQERVRAYAESRAIDGQSAIDDLIDFLEKNSETYTTYRDSDERKQSKVNFVNSPIEFNRFVVPGINRWVFLQIKPMMTLVEDTIIKGTLCKELYDHIKGIIKTNDPNVDGVPDFGVYAPLVPLIQNAVANLTLARTVDRIGLKVDTAVGVYQSFYKNANEPQQSKNVAGTDMSALAQQYRMDGERAMEQLKKELLDNVSDYPLYEDSDCYNSPEENFTTNETDNEIPGAVFFGI